MATDSYPAARDWFVLVAGWPGSGKSTLAAALATELGLPHQGFLDLVLAQQ